MAHVVTLEDFRPIPRYDTLAWTDARIEEASAREGPWAPVESFVLSPVDADPTAPMAPRLYDGPRDGRRRRVPNRLARQSR